MNDFSRQICVELTLQIYEGSIIALRALMSTTVDILCFISTCITPDNELLTVKYAFKLEILIYF